MIRHPAIAPETLPCGGVAALDPESAICAMICTTCLAVVGSLGMPADCKRLLDEKEAEG